jgi:hypothetical protein
MVKNRKQKFLNNFSIFPRSLCFPSLLSMYFPFHISRFPLDLLYVLQNFFHPPSCIFIYLYLPALSACLSASWIFLYLFWRRSESPVCALELPESPLLSFVSICVSFIRDLPTSSFLAFLCFPLISLYLP